MRTSTTLLMLGAMLLAGCTGAIGDDTDETTDVPGNGPSAFSCDPKASALTPSTIKRLPKTYFENSVIELLSPLDDATRAELLEAIRTRIDLIPNDVSEHYSPNDTNLTVDHVDAIFGVAVSLASKVSENPTYASQLLALCGEGSDTASLEDDACLTSFVTYYGRKAFRRPLSATEIDDFKAFYHAAVGQGVDGLGMLVGRFVGHPNFYYAFDDEGAIESGSEGVDAVYVLSKWELLSKITFLFWASPPTDALYDRVDAADITADDAALTQLVDDVLADPKTERGVLRFYREWLELDTTKTPATEGNVVAGQAMLAASGIDALPATHREDMIQEVLDLSRHYTLSTDGKLDDILTSTVSFAKTPALAQIYGVEPWNGDASHLVQLPAGQRSGLLTRAAFVSSGAEYTRPIIKGKTIRTRILCNEISPPPPGLDIKPLVHAADKTTRQAVEEATADDACQGCHSQMNPLGFVTENYDPTGRLRDKELRFADGTADVVGELSLDLAAEADLGDESGESPITNGIDLGAQIAESGTANTCMAMNYFEFVTGRAPDPDTDGCEIVAMRDDLAADDGSIRSMLRTTVLAKSFRRRMIQ